MMNSGSRRHRLRWSVQCLLLLCLLLLPAHTAWAFPKSDQSESPSDELVRSVMRYACIQMGPILVEASGSDMNSALAKATLPFALIGINESFFEDALPTFISDTPVDEGEELCAVALPPEEVLGLSGNLTPKIYLIVSFATGKFGIGISPPIEIMPRPPVPSFEDQHRVFRYLCPFAGSVMKSVLEEMGEDSADLEIHSRIAWAGAELDAMDFFEQPVKLPAGTELCVMTPSDFPEEPLMVSWPQGAFANVVNPPLLDQPLPELPAHVPGDGTWIVGHDMVPGLYRSTREFLPLQATPEGPQYYGEPCDFRLLSGFGGRDQDVIGGQKQAYASVIVQLGGEVRGLATENCGAWARLEDSALPVSANGTRRIGTDMEPGLWRSRHNSVRRDAIPAREDGQCKWMILNDFLWAEAYTAMVGSSSVWGQDQGTTVVVEIPATAVGFHSEFCDDWMRLE